MCRKLFLLGCFLALVLGGSSQTFTIDSLKYELTLSKEKDYHRVDLLNDLAFEYHRIDLDLSDAYLKRSDEVLEVLDYPKGKGRTLYLKGVVEMMQSNLEQATLYVQNAIQVYDTTEHRVEYGRCFNVLGLIAMYKGDYRGSIPLFKKTISINEAMGNNSSNASAFLNLGNVYADMSDYPTSIEHYEKALKIYTERDNQAGITKCLNNLGTVCSEQGNKPKALAYYYQAKSLYEKENDSVGISLALNNVASVFRYQGNYDKALDLYQESLALQQRSNRKYNVVRLKVNIGTVYHYKHDLETALQYYQEALELGQEIGDLDNVSSALNGMGDVYFDLDDPGLARNHYQRSVAINLKIDDQHSLSNSYLGIAETYVAEGNYSQALAYTLKSTKITDESEVLIQQSDAQSLLFRIYKAMGAHKKALQSHELFKTLEDSLLNKQNIEKMAQLEYEYKYKSELESANNREVKLSRTVHSTTEDLEKSQRNAFVAIIVILLLSLVSGGIIFYQKLRNARAINQNILIEQKLLRSQMTPHFIFNSLAILQGMILNKEEQNSISYLAKFSKLLRTVLENSRHKTVSLHKELAAIKSYVDLQNFSISPPIEFDLKIDPEILETPFKIPPMLIQPFIENALEHGFRNKKYDKRIELSLAFTAQKLVCLISDNGVGLTADQAESRKDKKSLATTITSERLAMLSKYFEVQGTVQVVDRASLGEQGTLVTLVIPYRIDPV